jgi:hypothetical protein
MKGGNMGNRFLRYLFIVAIFSLSLSACSQAATQAAAAAVVLPTSQPVIGVTPTEDQCSPTGITPIIKKVHDQMRAFDDITFVANMTTQAQLVDPILRLQDIRRNVEDFVLPTCAATLQSDAIKYMNAVITTLTHFMGGLQSDMVNQEVAASQNYRVQYEVERARLLGVTYVPQPTQVPVATATPSGNATPASQTTPKTEASINITNTGAAPANLRADPSMNGTVVGMLEPKKSLPAIGRNAAGDWIAVSAPDVTGGVAWIYTKLITIDKPVEQIPVIASTASAGISTTPTP